MRLIKKIIFIYIISKFAKVDKNISFKDLNFKKLDFTNYKQVKSFIFKNEFFKQNNKYVQSFDFLNFSQKLGGKIGINLSKKNILSWYKINKNKLYFPWADDLTSKRFLNIVYNYEFINSSSTEEETKKLNEMLFTHMIRINYDIKNKKIGDLTSYDIKAYLLCSFILKSINKKSIDFIVLIILRQIDSIGMHKSYNILEHAKFMNNLNEIKNIFLFFKNEINEKIEENIFKMQSILNEYFHDDGTIPLFNGSNNNYTKLIYESLNKDEYLKSRKFININNGIAFHSDKQKRVFFDIVQPNKDNISNNLSAGTLSFEFSSLGEKIITNCGATESFGKNPEYLRYSAAHSTLILQNTNISEIKENNPHKRFPQSVVFNRDVNEKNIIFEGSHNGYVKKFNKILKRKLIISRNSNKILGEDSIISLKKTNNRIFYHIRFHLVDGISYNFTNSKRNVILKTKQNNMWLFKSDAELVVEDSIIVDKNYTVPTKQIVVKGVINNTKQTRKWSLEKI